MSDDIVTRLRGYNFMRDGDIPDVIMSGAANEIELLRSDLDSCQNDLNYWYERCTRAEACANIMHNQINKKWWKR